MSLLRMFRRPMACLAGVAALMLLASAAAQAFTFEDQTTASGGAATKFSDPANRVKSRMSGDSSDKTRIQSGNTTLQFGGRGTFDERNNPDRLFSPNYLMGR